MLYFEPAGAKYEVLLNMNERIIISNRSRLLGEKAVGKGIQT